MSETVYQISRWREVFETSKSREFKTLTWISSPTSFNSTGYQDLLDSFEPMTAAALYGCWQALCQLAAQHPEKDMRGVLSGSNGEPDSIGRISRLTGLPREAFEQLIPWAIKVGWLVEFTGQVRDGTVTGPCHGPGESESGPLPNLTQPNLTPPPPPDQSESGPGPDSVAVVAEDSQWSEFQSELLELGLGCTGEIVDHAKGVMSADEALAIVEEFKAFPKGTAEVGAVAWRVRNGNWPFAIPKPRGDPERLRLEETHGDRLNHYSLAALRELCEHAGVEFQNEDSRTHPAYRHRLLLYLDRKEPV